MKPVISFLLTFVSLLGCTKKDERFNHSAPNGIYVNPSAKYLALGDSYSIGQSIPLDSSFPYQLSKLLGQAPENPTIIAATGWTSNNLITAVDQSGVIGNAFALVTLLVGVNDQYQGVSTTAYAFNFNKLLATAIELAGNQPKKVIVLSIPDYSVTPFAASANREEIASQIDQFNTINKQAALTAGVNYLDITDISRTAKTQPDLLATDGLHPSAKMYSLWVQRLEPLAKSVLNN